jgi:hypothetical protein
MTLKVALCFIISGEHVVTKERIWREWIEPNKDFINIYFHYKDITKIRSSWVREHAIPPTKLVKTSYFHIVPAYLTLLQYAMEQDGQNEWFCFLTESCAPVISPVQFTTMFALHSDKSIFKWQRPHWNTTFHKRANLKYLPKEYKLCHDPWFTLCKVDAELCLKFVKIKMRIFSTICKGGIANESLFAIVLKSYGRLRFVINSGTTITDWTRMTTPTSPHVFTGDTSLQDTKYIVNSKEKNIHSMFVRKIDHTFPDKLLRDIIYNTHTFNT